MVRSLRPGCAVLVSLCLAGGVARGAADGVATPAQQLRRAASEGDTRALEAALRAGARADEADAAGATALHWAAQRGDEANVKRLLRDKASVDAATDLKVTPLELAARQGHAAVVKRLLAAGADANGLDQAGETRLMNAVVSGSADTVRALIAGGARVGEREAAFGQTALMIAARGDSLDVVRVLLDAGAEVDLATPVGKPPAWRPPGAGGGSHGVGIVRQGVPERGMRDPIPGGRTALLYASREGRVDIARLLLDRGANIDLADPNGITPLLTAVTNGHMGLAELLLDRGADARIGDWYGRTPLWAAIDHRNRELAGPVAVATTDNGVDRVAALHVVERLLEAGVDVNARTTQIAPVRRHVLRLGDMSWVNMIGQTPFIRAAGAGDVTVMRLLLARGADPRLATDEGTTALMVAAGVNWTVAQTYDEGEAALIEAIELCLRTGIDLEATNTMGLRAIHGAANRGADGIVRVLADHGAVLDVPDAPRPHAARVGAGGVPGDARAGAQTHHDRAAAAADRRAEEVAAQRIPVDCRT